MVHNKVLKKYGLQKHPGGKVGITGGPKVYNLYYKKFSGTIFSSSVNYGDSESQVGEKYKNKIGRFMGQHSVETRLRVQND